MSEAPWTGLARYYREPLLIGLLLLARHSQRQAGFLSSAGLALEPAIEAALQAFPGRAVAG